MRRKKNYGTDITRERPYDRGNPPPSYSSVVHNLFTAFLRRSAIIGRADFRNDLDCLFLTWERRIYMIDIQNLSKRYGSVQALNDVSMQVRKNSVLGLLGQNGAGKTTLLNILTGYLAPTSGRTLIGGKDSLLMPEEAKRQLGYMPELPPLYDEMTIHEYLCFVSRLKHVHRRAIPAHVDEVMEKTGLADMRRRLLGHLSKGYRQRAAMAQALCGGPDVLVLDEPTAGLDPKQITEIRALIQSLSKDRTILFSSHILSEVEQLCDHVVILHQGRIKLNTPLDRMKSPDDVSLLCTIAAPETDVLPPLHGLRGIQAVSVQSSPGQESTTVLLTFCREAEPERSLFTLLSGLSLPILQLSRREASLEQVFLRTISEA